MIRTMDEINEEGRRLQMAGRLVREEFRYERQAYQADTAADALLADLNELDKVVNTISQVRQTIAAKVRGLYTGSQVGDAQTSEAELVSAPLRRRVAELEGRISNMSGWLDVKNGELASANAQRDEARLGRSLFKAERDAARAELEQGKQRREELAGMILRRDEVNATLRAEEDEARKTNQVLRERISYLENLLQEFRDESASRYSRIKELEEERQQAVDANRELIDRVAIEETFRDQTKRANAQLRAELARSYSDRNKIAEERDDYRTQLIEIRNVVLSDPIERALRPGNDPVDYATLLAEALIEIRSTVSVPDHDQPVRPRIDQNGRGLLKRSVEALSPMDDANLILDISNYLGMTGPSVTIDIWKAGPPSPLGPPDTE